jgi:hypothetical protein
MSNSRTAKPAVPAPTPQKLLGTVEIPMEETESKNGIISYLTKKHRGNVHKNGIVAITSKFVDDDPMFAVSNVADLTSSSGYFSRNEPDQWICWDFHKMRVRPTHYTLKACELKSWVVEGSVDGKRWTEIDRPTDNEDFSGGWNAGSFAVSNPTQCRFIRLTQTGKRHAGDDYLSLRAVEFFGTLSE